MSLYTLLLVNFCTSAIAFLALWRLSFRGRDPSFIDAWWPLGIVMLAWQTFWISSPQGPHAVALVALVSVWGVRLGAHLLWRWRAHGPDRRYDKLLSGAARARGWDYPLASLLLVFAAQMPLQFVVSLPIQLGAYEGMGALGPLAWFGVLVCAAGIAIESVADWQLVRFKADAASAGRVLQSGLWRYSRHPNHFGDACVWWGLYLVAAETDAGIWSFPGPILLTFLLLRVSGAPTMEPHLVKTRPDYAEYVRRTSAFWPMPPEPQGARGGDSDRNA